MRGCPPCLPDGQSVPVVTTLVCFFHLHTRLRLLSTPGIPCALVLRGAKCLIETRAKCAAGMSSHGGKLKPINCRRPAHPSSGKRHKTTQRHALGLHGQSWGRYHFPIDT